MINNIIVKIYKGNVTVHDSKSILQHFKALPDGFYNLSITSHQNKRSILQNNYYWGVVVPFVKDFFNQYKRDSPMTDKQAHAQFKDIAGLYEDVQIYDREQFSLVEKRVYASFSNAGTLSTVEFTNACDIVREAISIISNGNYILPEPIKNL